MTAAACWGLSAVVAKDAFAALSPVHLAQFRSLVAGGLLVVLAVCIDRGGLRLLRRNAVVVASLGASLAAVNATYYLAIERLPVGVAVTIQYIGPLLVLLIRRRTVVVGLWAAAVVAVTGAAFTAGFTTAGVNRSGVVLAGLSALAFAGYLLVGERLARAAGPVASVAGGFAAASIIWSVLQPWWSFPFGALGSKDVALRALFVSVAGSAIPFLLMLLALQRISAATGGVLASSEPAFGAAFAWLLLGESLAGMQIGGMVMTSVAVAVAQATSTRTG